MTWFKKKYILDLVDFEYQYPYFTYDMESWNSILNGCN